MGKQKKSRSRNRNRVESNNSKNVEQKEDSLYKIEESEAIGRKCSGALLELKCDLPATLTDKAGDDDNIKYLVAAKDLPAGEVVLCDDPFVVGPCQESKPLCIGCYVDIDLRNSSGYERCKSCSWPLCATNCSGYHRKYGHSAEECELLSKTAIKDKDTLSFEGFYYAITLLRCLVIKKNNPEQWAVLSGMESHTEERKKWKELWETNENLGVNVIQSVWGLKDFKAEEIHFVCGVLEVNAFEVNISPATQSLRAIYPKAYLFAHDCVPNTRRSNGPDFQMVFRTMRTISKNDMITISYAYTLQSTLMRRKHLKQTKFFSCTCKRCADPTEFGTCTGGVNCFSCKTGFLLPENPLDENSIWKCNDQKCNTQTNVSQIIPVLDRLFKELDSIGGNDIVGYERFIKKCNQIFPDNHYLILSAMHCLSQLYGKIHGYLINDLTDEQLERKEEICRKLIRIFEKFEPGLSKQKGILLYELQAPLMVLLRRRFQNLPKKELKSKIKEVLKYLSEGYLILSKEPEFSGERQMAVAAKEAITSLEGWLNLLN